MKPSQNNHGRDAMGVLCILFGLAGCCFLAGVVNHIVNTGEGIAPALLLALGCFGGAYACHKKKGG